MELNKLLSYSVDSGASDLHLSVGSIPMVRINGTIQRLNMDALVQEDMQSIIKQCMDSEQIKIFDERKEIDFSASLEGKGRFRVNIFNQIMETFSVNDLAQKIRRVGSERGHKVKINHIKNPRKEKEKHYYNPVFQGLLNIGVKPNYLTDEVINGIFKIVEKYSNNIREDVMIKGINW